MSNLSNVTPSSSFCKNPNIVFNLPTANLLPHSESFLPISL